MANVKCPACGKTLEVEDAYRDWTVRCPHCDGEFVPDEVQVPARPPRPAAARPRRRRDEEYDEDDDYDSRPAAREAALRLVSAPATWLEICGWLTVLASMGVAALCAVVGAELANNPAANGNGDPGVFVFMGCCAGVLGVPYGIAMAIGARKMRNLSSRGWALTSAILGIAAFTLFSCWGLIHTGLGVWALVTLEKPVVREAFGGPSRRSRHRDWDD